MFGEMKSPKGEMKKMFDEMKPEIAGAKGIFWRIRAQMGIAQSRPYFIFLSPRSPRNGGLNASYRTQCL